jgi:hypothetical protein
MPKDVFSSETKPTEAWKLDGAVISLNSGAELIVSSAQIQYARAVQKIYPLNSNKRIIILGKGQGSLNLGTVVGPESDLQEFIAQYSDGCSIGENSITIKSETTTCSDQGTKGTTFICSNLLLTTIQASVQASGSGDLAVINGGLGFELGGLEIT